MVVAKISQIYRYKCIHIRLHRICLKKCRRDLPFRSRTDIGTNDNNFLFVLQVTVWNLRDEGRRIILYSPCNICVSSARVLVALFTTCFPYRAVRVNCVTPVTLLLMFMMRCRLFSSFWLTFPNQQIKEKVKTLLPWYYDVFVWLLQGWCRWSELHRKSPCSNC